MKHISKTIGIIAALSLLNSCMVTSGSYDEVYAQPTSFKSYGKRITYSVSVEEETGGAPIIDVDELEQLVGEELSSTGLYSSVIPAKNQVSAGTEHYHFTFKLHGTNVTTKYGLTLLCIGTYTLIPFWYTEKVDVSMEVRHHNRNYVMNTDQYARRILWLPTILAAPFATRSKATENIVSRSIGYFTNEIIKNNLHQ